MKIIVFRIILSLLIVTGIVLGGFVLYRAGLSQGYLAGQMAAVPDRSSGSGCALKLCARLWDRQQVLGRPMDTHGSRMEYGIKHYWQYQKIQESPKSTEEHNQEDPA